MAMPKLGIYSIWVSLSMGRLTGKGNGDGLQWSFCPRSSGKEYNELAQISSDKLDLEDMTWSNSCKRHNSFLDGLLHLSGSQRLGA
jgi:hypothetical protein